MSDHDLKPPVGINTNISGTSDPIASIVSPTPKGININVETGEHAAFKMPNLSDSHQKSYVNPKDYERYITTGVMDNPHLDRTRADAQSFGGKFLGFLNQSIVGTIGGGAIHGIGAKLDIPDMVISEINGEAADWENFITRFRVLSIRAQI